MKLRSGQATIFAGGRRRRRQRRLALLSAGALLSLALGALAVVARGNAAETAATRGDAIGWPVRGDQAGNTALIDRAVRAWQPGDVPADRVEVLAAASDPVLQAIVVFAAPSAHGQRVVTVTGLRASGTDTMIVRDDRPADRVSRSDGLTVLFDTPEDGVDDSRVAVALAAPGATVEALVSSAFDSYTSDVRRDELLVQVVPASATQANTAAQIAGPGWRVQVPLQAASTLPAAPAVGSARIHYLPTGYQAADAQPDVSATTSSRTFDGPGGATLVVTEYRGRDLDVPQLLRGVGTPTAAAPHAQEPMMAAVDGDRWAFAWTDATRRRGFSVLASGGDAQIAAYHVAQALVTP